MTILIFNSGTKLERKLTTAEMSLDNLQAALPHINGITRLYRDAKRTDAGAIDYVDFPLQDVIGHAKVLMELALADAEDEADRLSAEELGKLIKAKDVGLVQRAVDAILEENGLKPEETEAPKGEDEAGADTATAPAS